MVYESMIMYRIEVWGLSKAWKELDNVHHRIYKQGYQLCSERICSTGALDRKYENQACGRDSGVLVSDSVCMDTEDPK
jgi:hypothetical protein